MNYALLANIINNNLIEPLHEMFFFFFVVPKIHNKSMCDRNNACNSVDYLPVMSKWCPIIYYNHDSFNTIC